MSDKFRQSAQWLARVVSYQVQEEKADDVREHAARKRNLIFKIAAAQHIFGLMPDALAWESDDPATNAADLRLPRC